MYKEIEPDLNELGIKILWAGTNLEETKSFTCYSDLNINNKIQRRYYLN